MRVENIFDDPDFKIRNAMRLKVENAELYPGTVRIVMMAPDDETNRNPELMDCIVAGNELIRAIQNALNA